MPPRPLTTSDNIMPAAVRVGIATLYDGSNEYRCALPLWCRAAAALAERLGAFVPGGSSVTHYAAKVVLLTKSDPLEDCMHASEHFWMRQIEVAAGEWVKKQRTDFSGDVSRAMDRRAPLLKWMLWALKGYEIVLFSDLDVYLAPGPRSLDLAWWHRSVSAFLQSSALLAGTPDHEAPLNTGIMLLKPRRWMYEEGLATLKGAVWTVHEGFNAVGRPRDQFNTWRLPGNIFTQLASGHTAPGSSIAAAEELMNRTAYAQKNSWDFVGGNLDQGLFWYLVFLRHRAGTWTAALGGQRWEAKHYWGTNKPWAGSLASSSGRPTQAKAHFHSPGYDAFQLSKVRSYLQGFVHGRGVVNHSSPTVCMQKLRHWKAVADAERCVARTRPGCVCVDPDSEGRGGGSSSSSHRIGLLPPSHSKGRRGALFEQTERCMDSVQNDTWWHGNWVDTLPRPPRSDGRWHQHTCAAACASHPKCNFWNLQLTGGRGCHLLEGRTRRVAAELGSHVSGACKKERHVQFAMMASAVCNDGHCTCEQCKVWRTNSTGLQCHPYDSHYVFNPHRQPVLPLPAVRLFPTDSALQL